MRTYLKYLPGLGLLEEKSAGYQSDDAQRRPCDRVEDEMYGHNSI